MSCREQVHLRRRFTQNNPEIEFLISIKEKLELAQQIEIGHVILKLTDHIEALKLGTTASAGANETSRRNNLDALNDPPRSEPSRAPSPEVHDFSIVTAIEHLAWGRSNRSCYPHRHCSCQYRRNFGEGTPMNSQSFELGTSKLAAVVSLPRSGDAEKLISFHLTRITWHHNCIHSPTFWKQCQVFWQTGKCDHPQWIALYCSILSTTLFCVQNSADFLNQFDFDPDLQTAENLFMMMVDVLHASNFLQNVSFYAVQAIVISAEVAHNLGLSQLNATLFSAAVRLAECLGVHKIQDGVSPTITPAEAWFEAVDKEVGKRVWCQMVVQDYFAIPFTDSYIINPAQYSTSLPSNAHDHDLIARADSIPTISTYTRVLATIAKLMPEFVDGLGPLSNRKSLQEQYDHVLRMDQKMRDVVRTIPEFLLRQDAQQELRVGWLGIARHSLAITAAEKIIMIHRPFIFRSFFSDTYAHTRRTCVSAAMTILREHENIALLGELCLWTHTAFCITATVLLCFELTMGPCSVPQERLENLRELVQVARQRLERRKHDVLARRGILLINAILPGADDATDATNRRSRTIDFEEVVKRFNSDLAFLGADSVIGEGSLLDGLAADDQLHLVDNDLDTWFSDVFTTADVALQ